MVKDPEKLLTAAKHALLSYVHGNAAPDLGRDLAAKIDEYLKRPEIEHSGDSDRIHRRYGQLIPKGSGLECPGCIATKIADEEVGLELIQIWRILNDDTAPLGRVRSLRSWFEVHHPEVLSKL